MKRNYLDDPGYPDGMTKADFRAAGIIGQWAAECAAPGCNHELVEDAVFCGDDCKAFFELIKALRERARALPVRDKEIARRLIHAAEILAANELDDCELVRFGSPAGYQNDPHDYSKHADFDAGPDYDEGRAGK